MANERAAVELPLGKGFTEALITAHHGPEQHHQKGGALGRAQTDRRSHPDGAA